MSDNQNLGRMWGAIARVSSILGLPDPTPAGTLEFDTAGGDPDPRDVFPPPEDEGRWVKGWWDIAEKTPIHEGRMGGAINFWCVVTHTTDMHPDRFGSLLKVWKKEKGRGAGAHFALGRDPEEGLHQLCSITRNGNHAGGPQHGWLLDGKGKRHHPNGWSVGIEVSCAGPVFLIKDEWRTATKVNGVRVPFGRPIPAAEVERDPQREGRGWHKPSEWQVYMLHRLYDALADSPHRVAPPLGWTLQPNGDAPAYAPTVTFRGDDRGDIPAMPIIGHVTIDPNRKGDPWPPLSRVLRERYSRRMEVVL